MTDDQRRAALREEQARYARIVVWRQTRQSMSGDDRPDAVAIVAMARMKAANRMLWAMNRAAAIDPDIPF